jgi:hypothetical protein
MNLYILFDSCYGLLVGHVVEQCLQRQCGIWDGISDDCSGRAAVGKTAILEKYSATLFNFAECSDR